MPLSATSAKKVSFSTCDVPIAEKPLAEVPYHDALKHRLFRPGVSIEAASRRLTTLVPTTDHAFMDAVHLAFAQHRPLVLSPDHIWLLICQGFALHVNANAEMLRSDFVIHTGKKPLIVTRPNFVKGGADNDWEGIISEFGQRIRANLKSNHDLLVANFSTTTSIEKAAFEITLMDAMKSYFDYGMTICGIPSITLEGTPEDWQQIVERTQKLRGSQCGKWVSAMTPILQQFVRASRGHVNRNFWRSIYKVHSVSGGPYITGWIIRFFPYLRGEANLPIPNPYLGKWFGGAPKNAERSKLSLMDLSSGLSQAPVTLDTGTQQHNLEFVAGFIGIAQDSDSKALRPEIGWAILDVSDAKK
jgi:hypothetical protein